MRPDLAPSNQSGPDQRMEIEAAQIAREIESDCWSKLQDTTTARRETTIGGASLLAIIPNLPSSAFLFKSVNPIICAGGRVPTVWRI